MWINWRALSCLLYKCSNRELSMRELYRELSPGEDSQLRGKYYWLTKYSFVPVFLLLHHRSGNQRRHQVPRLLGSKIMLNSQIVTDHFLSLLFQTCSETECKIRWFIKDIFKRFCQTIHHTQSITLLERSALIKLCLLQRIHFVRKKVIALLMRISNVRFCNRISIDFLQNLFI